MIDLAKYEKALLTLLDRGTWKSSRHLIKDPSREIAWANRENQSRIYEIIQQRKEELAELQTQIAEAETALEVLHRYYNV